MDFTIYITIKISVILREIKCILKLQSWTKILGTRREKSHILKLLFKATHIYVFAVFKT